MKAGQGKVDAFGSASFGGEVGVPGRSGPGDEVGPLFIV
jgi:hypothetical protein